MKYISKRLEVQSSMFSVVNWIDGALWAHGIDADMYYEAMDGSTGNIIIYLPKMTKKKEEFFKTTIKHAKKVWQKACEIKINIKTINNERSTR